MAKFKNGDRVKGLGKTGTIIELYSGQICPDMQSVRVLWDGGKRKTWVDSAILELL